MSINSKMTAIADAIRLKTGKTETLTLDQMAGDLNAITERDEIDLTVNGATITVPAGNYKSQVSANVSAATQATPSITINASGLITATATQAAGYVAAGTKSATKQLAFQSAKTITPGTTSQTAITSGTFATGSVIVNGDSNLKASNIVSGVSIFGIRGTYVGGDTDIEDGLILKTLRSYSNSRITEIGSYAFYRNGTLNDISFPNCITIKENAFTYCSNLKSASFPNCTVIQSSAFQSCHNLSIINFPKCTSIGNRGFIQCNDLTAVSLPECITIEGYAFANGSTLSTVSLPKCTTAGVSVFDRCTQLQSIYMPMCTTLGACAFSYCQTLTSIDLPECTVIGKTTFYSCAKLTTINIPKCSTIGSSAFCSCSSLRVVSFPVCVNISSSAFAYCSKLSSIYLANSSVCILQNSNAFIRTSITSTTGSIYVPLSLGWSYKTATNWTYFSNRIFSIEGDEIVNPDAGGGGSGELITFNIRMDEYQAEDGMTWGEWVESDYNTGGIYINPDTGGVMLDEYEQVCDEDLMPVYERDLIIADMFYDSGLAEH